MDLYDYSINVAEILYLQYISKYISIIVAEEHMLLEADVLNIHIVTIFQEYCIPFLCKIIFLRRFSNISRCRSGVAGSMTSAISLCNFIYLILCTMHTHTPQWFLLEYIYLPCRRFILNPFWKTESAAVFSLKDRKLRDAILTYLTGYYQLLRGTYRKSSSLRRTPSTAIGS